MSSRAFHAGLGGAVDPKGSPGGSMFPHHRMSSTIGTMTVTARGMLLALFLLCGGGGVGQAQSTEEPVPFCEDPARRAATLDTRGLGAVYCTPHSAVARPLRGAHTSARPVFYGAVPLAWSVALLRGGTGGAEAYRLTLTQGATYGLVLGLKRAVGRPRPYVRRPLSARSSRHPADGDRYTSFPSGHAALAAGIAASWSLSYPRWYVIGPGAIWAVGVSLSRVHLGVHYPTDVVAGAVLGTGVALLVHSLREALTPDRIRNPGAAPAPISLHVRF